MENTPLLANRGPQDIVPTPSQLSSLSSQKYLFAAESNIDPELFCSICQQVFTNPVRSVNCGHSFCKDCIDRWAEINTTCPLDKLPLGQMQFDRLAFNLIENLSTECQVCQWKGNKALLRGHLKESHSIEIPAANQGNFGYSTVPAQIPESNNQNQHFAMPYQQGYPQQPMARQILSQTAIRQAICYYHGERLGVARCTTCGKSICVNCTRFYQTYRWGVSSVLCPECYSSRRFLVFVYSFIIFFVFSVISIVLYFLLYSAT
eukprot:TRINITY_DN185_c0_g1_i1.p1 TRINITY_DN185_c0_g1~~TRINITY_DN185_c0_g1_i1.p1  ORF type:complete len:262 (-),score=29.41 TRINITY_DN185_c0_g1_i1:78-863(-)